MFGDYCWINRMLEIGNVKKNYYRKYQRLSVIILKLRNILISMHQPAFCPSEEIRKFIHNFIQIYLNLNVQSLINIYLHLSEKI